MKVLMAAVLPAALLCVACGGSGVTPAASSASNPSPSASAGSGYAAVFKQVNWGTAVTASFSGTCTMTLTTTGVPPAHNDYYLAPVSSQYPNAVAVTPVSNTQMSVVPYTPSSITGQTLSFNICPVKASSTTTTNMGVIGYMVGGEAIFNPYEGGGAQIPAISDNVSYTFTAPSGKTETASFIDACNSHPTPLSGGYTWHYHGVPSCLAAQIDGSTGPSHLLGIALDGFPIYGGRDINGNTISVSQLDACNGITSPTPEFPSGVYHYVLPIGVTGKQSSLNCYSGSVSAIQMAFARKLICSIHPAGSQTAAIRTVVLGRTRRTGSV